MLGNYRKIMYVSEFMFGSSTEYTTSWALCNVWSGNNESETQ